MTASALVWAVVALLVALAVVVAGLRRLFPATVVFGAYSLGVAILWVVLLAPDVALTEAAVGAGVTTSLFLVAVARTVGTTETAASASVTTSSVAAVAALAVALLATVPALPATGSAASPPFQRVAPYYLANAVPELGVPNAVTAVLAGYRAFDTFGEVTVVFAAGVAVLAALGREVV